MPAKKRPAAAATAATTKSPAAPPPKSRRRRRRRSSFFFAVRRGASGSGLRRCIFLDWDDCVDFLVTTPNKSKGDDDEEEEVAEEAGDDEAEYERFASVAGAVRYLLEAAANDDDEAGRTTKKKAIGGGANAEAEAKKAGGKRPRGRPRKVVAEAVVVEASAATTTTSATKRRRGRPRKSGVGTDAEADDERDGKEGGRRPKKKPRKSRRTTSGGVATTTTNAARSEEGKGEGRNETSAASTRPNPNDGGAAAANDRGRKEKDTATKAEPRRRSPGEAWMNLYERLKRFKEVHGHLDVPPAPAVSAPAVSAPAVASPRANPTLLPAVVADDDVDVDPIPFASAVAAAASGGEDSGEISEDAPNAAPTMATTTEPPAPPPPPPCPVVDEEEEDQYADLRRFVERERRRYRQRSKATSSFDPSSVAEEKVRLLQSIGLDLDTSPPTPPPPSKLEQKWERNFEKLRAYHAEHGHTMVPSKKHELGTWVHIQRREYRKLRAGTKSGLTFDRMRRLSDLGFVWIVRKKDYTTWNERIEQLREFRAAHGHAKVPVSHPVLGDFVSHTRNMYAKYLSGRPTSLTPQKITELESVGFVFCAGKRLGSRRKPNRTWEERFEDLVQFKERHGHAVVPQAYRADPSLGEWVHKQRRMYKQLRKGETNNNALTPERAFRLTELGFVFDAVKHRGSTFA